MFLAFPLASVRIPVDHVGQTYAEDASLLQMQDLVISQEAREQWAMMTPDARWAKSLQQKPDLVSSARFSRISARRYNAHLAAVTGLPATQYHLLCISVETYHPLLRQAADLETHQNFRSGYVGVSPQYGTCLLRHACGASAGSDQV